MTRHLTLLLALAVAATAPRAQTDAVATDTLVVTVVSADGEPLVFADVFLPETLASARTDADGVARLSGLAPGTYRVEVTPFHRREQPAIESVQVGNGVTFLRVTLLMAVPSVTTGRLSGTVTDDSGESLPGATVFLPQIQRGAATDIDGNYTILGIPIGVYEVQFSSIGFGPQTIEDVQISRDRTRELNISLGSPDEQVVYTGGPWRPLISNGIYSPRILWGWEVERLPNRY